jgi:hypothetical protein
MSALVSRKPALAMALLFALAILGAISLAFADNPIVSASTSTSTTTPTPTVHGISPMPNDDKVPLKWLPPGAFDPDRGPSTVVFPPQKITIRFNHKLHIGLGQTCVSCHVAAPTSQSVQDTLIPKASKCDQCHLTDHSDPLNVKSSGAMTGQCGFCHNGWKDTDGNLVARLVIPRPNMVFSHKAHISRNIGCQQCHGDVQELELATRDQMPRMRGCFGCHQLDDAASRGLAKSDCITCHIQEGATGTMQQLPEHVANNGGGRMRTMFASGTLQPPRWLHNAAHSADFMERHKMIAANDSQFCSNCHKEDFCVACHDGRVRPRNVHPNDWISMHPIEARQATEKCTSCHREQSFCLTCHQRVGVTMSGPENVRQTGRFHPPKSIWSDPPRKPGHHSQEAMRNINACVSCHVERDCVVCHGGLGIGGGFNPHNASFASGCKTQFRRNPRPCLVCHDPGSGDLAQCR